MNVELPTTASAGQSPPKPASPPWRTGANITVSAVVVAVSVGRAPAPLIGLAVAALIAASCEVLIPLHVGRRCRRAWLTDLTHAIGNRCLILPLIAILLSVTGPPLAAVTPAEFQRAVAGLPWLAQLTLTLLATDCASYLAHRGLHRVGFLWRFHAIHHSSERLDWLATSRGHPIDEALNVAAATLPIYVLGDARLAPWLVTFMFVYPFVAHANARLRIPYLDRVVVTPAFHHWHHAADTVAHDKNFGAFLTIWDRLFNTAIDSADFPGRYGIDRTTLASADYLGHLVAPFRHAISRRFSVCEVVPAGVSGDNGGPLVDPRAQDCAVGRPCPKHGAKAARPTPPTCPFFFCALVGDRDALPAIPCAQAMSTPSSPTSCWQATPEPSASPGGKASRGRATPGAGSRVTAPTSRPK